MISWIILLVKQYLDIVKYLLIGNAIFDLNYDKNKLIKENVGLALLVLLVYIIFYREIAAIWIDLNMLVCLIYLVIIYRDKVFQTFKVVVITILVTTMLEQIFNLVIEYNLYAISDTQFIIANILRFIIVLCGAKAIKTIRKLYDKKYSLSELPWYLYMNIIFCFSATLFPQFIVVIYHDVVNPRVSMIIILVAYLNIIVSFISIILFVKNKKEKEQYYLNNIMKDKTLKLQEEYYLKLIDNYSNIRKFKHDIKGHLSVVNRLIKTKNYDEANNYLGNMFEIITGNDLYNTPNIYISSILNSFDQSFIDNQIKFDLSYHVVGDLIIDDLDICSLFYNLISNAIEANLKIENDRFIKLVIVSIKNNLIIKIVNPVGNNFELENITKNKTTKKDQENHGLGLITIDNIISKYKGKADYGITNHNLVINITMLNVLKND